MCLSVFWAKWINQIWLLLEQTWRATCNTSNTHTHTVTYTDITVTTRRLPFPALKCMLRFRICDRYWASWGHSERAKLTWPQLAANCALWQLLRCACQRWTRNSARAFYGKAKGCSTHIPPSLDALCRSVAPCELWQGEDKQNHSNRRQLRQLEVSTRTHKHKHTLTLARCLSSHWQLIGQSTLWEKQVYNLVIRVLKLYKIYSCIF